MNNKLDYIAIDFEIANQYRNSACSVGLVRFLDGKETDSCYSLIHPAKMYFIPEWTRDIHHISYNDVRNKPYFPEIWDNGNADDQGCDEREGEGEYVIHLLTFAI